MDFIWQEVNIPIIIDLFVCLCLCLLYVCADSNSFQTTGRILKKQSGIDEGNSPHILVKVSFRWVAMGVVLSISVV